MKPSPNPLGTAHEDLEAALATMSIESLREIVHEVMGELDDRTRARLIAALIARAAKGSSGWVPVAVSDAQVAEVLAFVEAARRTAQAEPADVDERLQLGSSAFLGRHYDSAQRIFGALLLPICRGEIDLGQDELADEVLGSDLTTCATQYVVSVYMTSPAEERADAVFTAINSVRDLGQFWEPLREMERVAVEPLPAIEDFLRRWRSLVVSRPKRERSGDWDRFEDRWLREVVQYLEGSDGLAKLARSTRRADDLRAWCRCLGEAGNWEVALAAFEEAAGLVINDRHARGEFLDGAALAAQRLGREELPAMLERAWHASPSMPRLRCWLGSLTNPAALERKIAEALEHCPKQAVRQRALLHVLNHDFSSAAKLLANSAGLGWSDGEHPGHLLFPIFAQLIGGKETQTSSTTRILSREDGVLEERDPTAAGDDSRLFSPPVLSLLERAGVDGIVDAASRTTVLDAMRMAAESRVAGVTDRKRRRHYGHAAELVATCAACDETGDAARWAAKIKAGYRRFPAFRDALEQAMEGSQGRRDLVTPTTPTTCESH